MSQLHVEECVGFAHEGAETVRIDADEHLAIAIAFYNEVIRPAVRLTGELLAARAAALDESRT